jgi:hypothetical protein
LRYSGEVSVKPQTVCEEVAEICELSLPGKPF